MPDLSVAIQDDYPSDFSHCYGCGRLNGTGLQLKSRWESDEVVARFTPRAEHVAVPGFVYGGLIASLVDCHAIATAAAHAARRDGVPLGEGRMPRFVTGSLRVDYLKPTPAGCELELRARVRDAGERKATVEFTLAARGDVTVRGEAIAVRMPSSMQRGGNPV
jgi:acyl-coenzyme A thioesterase PaaI-like protein